MIIRLKPLALLLPLLLWGCLFEPGKFVSALTVNADRSFAFSYTGEVIAAEPQSSGGASSSEGGEKKEAAAPPAAPDADKEAEYRAVAEAMRKEPGFIKAEYVGNRVFMIDYRASGSLTHAFAFPFNIDAKMLLPFVAVELRGKDGVRVMAPGFANENKDQMASMLPTESKQASRLDGIFTLTTAAEIVSQNNEAGATAGAKGGKTIAWRVNALTREAPMAVLRVAPLP
jgi:hypothetical protein